MFDIIYEDNSIVVVNKPSGISTIPDGYNVALPNVRQTLEATYGRLWVVHRLDKCTSGVLIFAKSEIAHKFINDQFAARKIKKSYVALVYGSFPEELSEMSPLLINGDRRHRTIVDPIRGKPAQTDFNLIEKYITTTSLIRAIPQTGYTHQIRSHLLHAGFPILGDALYFNKQSVDFSVNLHLERTALHSEKISFFHPESNTFVTYNAPIPPDFQRLINKIS